MTKPEIPDEYKVSPDAAAWFKAREAAKQARRELEAAEARLMATVTGKVRRRVFVAPEGHGLVVERGCRVRCVEVRYA